MTFEKYLDLKYSNEKFSDYAFKNEIIADVGEYAGDLFEHMSVGEVARSVLSIINWSERRNNGNLMVNNLNDLKVGDICHFDYGLPMVRECSYQHLGLILKVYDEKFLVVPMSSSQKFFNEVVLNSNSSYMVMPAGLISVSTTTTLMLNDIKFISPSRVLSRVGDIDVNSEAWEIIKNRAKEALDF